MIAPQQHQISKGSASPVVADRIDTIAAWTKKADLLFPVVSKFLGTTTSKKDIAL